ISFFFQAEDGIRDFHVTGVQTCALPIYPVGVEIRYISEFCSIGVRSTHTKGIKPFKGIVEIVVFFHSCDQFGISENYPRIPAPDHATGDGADVVIEPETSPFGIDPRVEIKRRSLPVRFEVSHQMERHQWIGLLVSIPLLERDGRTGFYSKDRKSTRLNSSHVKISYAVFCLKKKKKKNVT